MTGRFDYFAIIAEMRTGSNFLEANINAFAGLTCHGEAFNNAFIGYPNTDRILGVTQAQRDADPGHLIAKIKACEGLGGFRYFRDHDPRVLETILSDPRCAKIILTRNPVDSFVSLQIARATGQWKLTNVKHARREKVHFDPEAFTTYLAEAQAFQVHLLNALQISGQTAFYLAYEDLQNLDILNGVAAYLGCSEKLDALDGKLKRQNPQSALDKVSNPDEMAAALAERDIFNLTKTPNFEPRRGPRVPHYIAASKAPLLYLPISGGPDEAVETWLSLLDDGATVRTGFTRKSLKDWKKNIEDHRSFTVIRHPLARAHAAFCDKVLPSGNGGFPEIRQALRKAHDIPLPAHYPDVAYDDAAHKEAFNAFLQFLQKNLTGQTGVRVDASWASQTSLLQGLADISPPDMVIREQRLQDDLAILCAQIGRDTMPGLQTPTDRHSAQLARIVDPAMQAAGQSAYEKDFINFGFGDWEP